LRILGVEPAEEMGRFGIARNAFDRIVKEFPATPLVPSALGRFGDCSLQLKLYAEAISAYNACIQHPRATVTERGLAEIGIGQVLEKQAAAAEGAEQQALMTAAQERYLNVFLQGNLRTQEGEVRDLSLVQAAGMNAARLSESRRDWQGAAKLYTRLLEMLPSLKDYLDPRIRQMEERARAGG
jgi:tetratricopeptide (TPR) repeat protein